MFLKGSSSSNKKNTLSAHLLQTDLQVGHVGLKFLGNLVALMVEREPAVHEAQQLRI